MFEIRSFYVPEPALSSTRLWSSGTAICPLTQQIYGSGLHRCSECPVLLRLMALSPEKSGDMAEGERHKPESVVRFLM